MNNHFPLYKWLLKHSEDIGGAMLAMSIKLFDGALHFADINVYALAERLASDAPGYFMAGFMGGLGGFTIRWVVSRFTPQSNSDEKKG